MLRSLRNTCTGPANKPREIARILARRRLMIRVGRAMRTRRAMWTTALINVTLVAALGACTSTHSGDDTTTPVVTTGIDPVEYVGYHNEVPLDPTKFHALASGLFGSDAQGGKILP